MTKSNIKLLLILLPVLLFFSCVRDFNDNLDQNEQYNLLDPGTMAQINFIHAYTPLSLGGSPALSTTSTGFRVIINGEKINAATNTSSSTNTLMYGGTFPATTAYAVITPGQKSVSFTMNRIVTGNFAPVSGDEIFNASVSLMAGKKYSLFIADPYAAPDVNFVEDNFKVPTKNGFGIRFINLCADMTSRFDVVSARHGILFSDLGYKEMQDFKYLLVPSASDTIFLRTAGTNTTISQINGFLPGSQRVYTLYARGSTGVSGRLPNITYYTNR